jgi:hypothetical protein
MLGGVAIGIPPRAKKVQVPRRRLPILYLEESVQAVKIIHLNQNLGTSVPEAQPVQSTRV